MPKNWWTLIFWSFRLAKTYIPKKYSVLPPWRVTCYEDPHDYKLRSFEEVLKEQEENPPDIVMENIYDVLPWIERDEHLNYQNRRVIIT